MILPLIFLGMWVAYLPPALKSPVPLDGIATVALLTVSLGVIALAKCRHFQLWAHWVPWLLVLSVGFLRNPDPTAGYRCLLYLVPMLVGWASLLLVRRPYALTDVLLVLCRTSVVILLAGTAWTMWVVGTHTEWSFERAGGAPATVAVIIVLLCIERNRIARLGWVVLGLLNPLLGLNRMALLVAVLAPALRAFALRATTVRVLAGMGIGLGALVAMLAIPSIQAEMFYSGDGSLLTFFQEPADVRTHGRARFWAAVYLGMTGWDWIIGNGADTSAAVVASAIAGKTHPHNDWLRILYDYGAIGILAFLYGLAREFAMLTPPSMGPYATVARAGLCALALLMVTGNVALYGIFFGNIIFSLAGLARRSQVNREEFARYLLLRQRKKVPFAKAIHGSGQDGAMYR